MTMKRYNTAKCYSMSAYSLSLLECLMNVWSSKCPKLNSWLLIPSHLLYLPHMIAGNLQPASCLDKKLWSHPLILSFYNGLYKIYQQVLWVIPSYLVYFIASQPFSLSTSFCPPQSQGNGFFYFILWKRHGVSGVFSTTWHIMGSLFSKMFNVSILSRVRAISLLKHTMPHGLGLCFCLTFIGDVPEVLLLFRLVNFLNWCFWTTLSKVFKDTSGKHKHLDNDFRKSLWTFLFCIFDSLYLWLGNKMVCNWQEFFISIEILPIPITLNHHFYRHFIYLVKTFIRDYFLAKAKMDGSGEDSTYKLIMNTRTQNKILFTGQYLYLCELTSIICAQMVWSL